MSLFMLGHYRDADATAGLEGAGYLDPMRIERAHQVIANRVGHMLVKHALVAVRPQVEFEGLRLDDPLVRYVLNGDCGEIRLAGGGADTGELVGGQRHRVAPFRIVIWKSLELLA